MKKRTLAAILAVVLALLFGFLGDGTDVEFLSLMAGLLFLTAFVLFVSILPFWAKILPDVPPMPDLFPKPFAGQVWCVACGTPTAPGTCAACGAPAGRRPKASKAQKQSAKVK